MFVELMSVNHSARSESLWRYIFDFLLYEGILCDSNEYTQYTIFIIKRTSPYIILNIQLWNFFKGWLVGWLVLGLTAL